MIEFNYRNKDNFIRFGKYLFGFLCIYGITITYFIKEGYQKQNLNPFIGGIFVIMCVMMSMPFLKSFMQTFFEKIVVDEREISYYKNFGIIKMPWPRVQYFIRLPSRGIFTGLVIYYEMGDFKKKILFESTITDREKLIRFIQQHVGKLRKIRKRYR